MLGPPADARTTRRYILTGAPGAGKTTLLRALGGRGWPVSAEAATEVIAREQARGVDEPWTEDGFLRRIADLQHRRQQRSWPAGDPVQFYDRSPLCTLALAEYLGLPVPSSLTADVSRIVADHVYERRVFLVRLLGFIEPTAARRIGYDEALAFEAIHEKVYTDHGFTLVEVGPAGVAERAAAVEAEITVDR